MENHPAFAIALTAPRRKRPWLRPVVRVAILAVAVLAGVFVLDPFSASSTEVGSCLKGDVTDADSVESAECGQPEANFKVVGKQAGKSEVGLRLSGGSECDEYPTTDAYFFQGSRMENDGTLLCLEDLKNPGERLPVVGDCLPGDALAANKFAKVDCAGAYYKVLAIEKRSGVALEDTACTSVPSADAKISWQRPGGVIPYERVLCLDDLKS